MNTVFSRILQTYYNIKVMNIIQQDGGWSAGAYKIETPDDAFFLKVYDKQRNSTKLWTKTINTYMPIVLWLHTNTTLNGRIICPALTLDGKYMCEDEQYIYFLFPYIEGYPLCDKPMTENQVIEIAEIIAELHKYGSEIPIPTDDIKEDFAVPFCNALSELLILNDGKDTETTSILSQYKQALRIAIEKTEQLSKKLSDEDLSFVLCHTDVHGWNIMQSDRLILIDWEGMKLAPPEADLFAFVGNLFWHNCSEKFMSVYQTIHPDFKLNKEVLYFYQTRRKIEDIYAFTQRLLYEDLDNEERKQALYHLRQECASLSQKLMYN